MTLAGDYAILRHGVGARMSRRDGLVMSGPDAELFLQGQCSQDVEALAPGESADALLLSPQGKLQGYVRVTRRHGGGFLLDTDQGFGEAARERLVRFRLRVKVDIDQVTLACVALRGPESPAPETLAATPGVEVAVPVSWGPFSGVDLLGPAPVVPPGVAQVGGAAWEAARIEAGVPVLGAELDERTIAAEAGIVARTVSFTKGCYTGQELVARIDSRGNRVARSLQGVVVGGLGSIPEDPDASPPPLVGGELVVSGDSEAKVIGRVTSAAWSPSLGAVALAYVHRSVEAPASLDLRLADGSLLAAESRALPLAR